MTGLEEVLKRAAADLDAVGAKWAIIGGLAVATRAAPRFTQDVDFAVSVHNDAEAENIVHRMSVRGYAVGMILEQDYVHRLATIRLIRPVPGESGEWWLLCNCVLNRFCWRVHCSLPLVPS